MNAPSPKSPAKELLNQLLKTTSSTPAFQGFLRTHMADDVQGVVGHARQLDKARLMAHLNAFWAMASGGQTGLLRIVTEGSSACVQMVLSKKAHTPGSSDVINLREEVAVEASLWIDLDANGRIHRLHLLGDLLTPGLTMGLRMVKEPA